MVTPLRIFFLSLLGVAGNTIKAEGIGQGNTEPSRSGGRLTAGVSFDIPGMGYKNPKTDVIEGFEPNLARAVAKELLGAPDRVAFVRVLDKDRITALEHGRVDIVVSQLTITPEREQQVDFSVPYMVTGEGLLVPKGSNIRRFEDLAGKRITATAGSLSLKRMRGALPSLPGAKLVVRPTISATIKAVANNEADAASNDLINLKLFRSALDRPDQYELVDIAAGFEQKPFSIAVKKGNSALVERLNKAINSLKSSGSIEKLLNEAIANIGR